MQRKQPLTFEEFKSIYSKVPRLVEKMDFFKTPPDNIIPEQKELLNNL